MMIYNGETRTCGLIGNPVEHTLSPLLQNYLAEETGTNMVYVPFHVEKGRLEEAVKGAHALNLLGCNVTVPYKTDVVKYVTELDDMAARIGAVNTLVRNEHGFKGYNTDMLGLYRAMLNDGVDPEGRECVILGAGGVARAVAVLLLEKKASHVYILNRTLERAQAIAEEVNQMAGSEFVKAYTLKEYDKLPGDQKFLVIQATNVGMHPHIEEVVIEEEAFYERVEVGYDLIFNPGDTRFMQMTSRGGGKAYNGAKMLVYQGIIAFELWNGITISQKTAEVVNQLVAEALKK
ncbi:MAG: shikimate dehydrogenase [Lachnospiraceae bacterium]|nr:shikimate dehydrogenase [Lachnospiraceae bacterium]